MTCAALFAAYTLRLVLERKSLTATWRTYRQTIDGVDVVGSAVIERDGVECGGRAAAIRAPARPAHSTEVYVLVNGEARPARRIADAAAIHYIDDSGAEIRTESLVWNAKARVFDPNPVAKLNDPSLRDQNNAASAVPDAAYTVVDLPDLPPAGMLAGPNVAIVDTDQPFTAHADAAQPLFFDRSQPQFEEVNAYFHLDRSQRYMQSLGFTGERRIVGYSIPVDPHAFNGADNSAYVGGNANGMGQLFFGDGGTDDAEDSDIMLHEFGHAIQDWIDPGVFGGLASQQSRALGEGFGDYWSFSQNYVGTIAGGRDPYCIADWDARCGGDDASQNCGYAAGADCLRRVDSTKTMADYVVSTQAGTEHRNGEIWSSALREIFEALVQQNGVEQGRRIADTIVLEGTFGVPPDPTFNVMARKLLDADRALYGGAHAATICASMTRRGILTGCSAMPRGELTILQSSDHGVPIANTDTTSTLLVTDTRPVDRLLVRVDIEHPSRGDLRITLVAPDGTTRTLFAPSLDRVPDIHATFGSDIEPLEPLTIFNGKSIAGVWKLVVADTHGNGVGRLLSWSLVVKFSGDEPLAARPAAAQHIVAVAHANGLDGARWRSDLFLFNKASSAVTATIIFTPSGADGTTTFGAVNVGVAPGEVAVFRDVVAQLFAADGLGTLALSGNVQAWSRTVDAARGLGEGIEAVPASDAVGVGDAGQFTIQLFIFEPYRANLGVIETAGQPGTVRFTAFNLLISGQRWSQDVDIAPYGHVQFRMPGLPSDQGVYPYIQIQIVAGAARVHGYASLVAPGNDPRFIKAQQPRAGTFAAPVIGNVRGSNGTSWGTVRFWHTVLPFPAPFARETIYDSFGQVVNTSASNGGGFSFYPIQGVHGSGIFELPAGWVVWLRNTSDAGGGDESVAVPVAEALGNGDSADAIRIENDTAFRTNVGAAEVTGGSAALRFTLFDNGGKILGSVDRLVGPHQQLQFSLRELSASPVLDGRVRVEVVGGDGRVVAYASVVNNATTDSEFVRLR